MAYIRRTRDRWDIMTRKGGSWHLACSKYSREDAMLEFQKLANDSRRTVRLEKHRDQIEDETPVGTPKGYCKLKGTSFYYKYGKLPGQSIGGGSFSSSVKRRYVSIENGRLYRVYMPEFSDYVTIRPSEFTKQFVLS